MEVKANQPELRWELERLFEDARLVAETGTRTRTTDLGHGRLEVRTCRTSTALTGYTDWPELAQAACIERTRTVMTTGVVTRETAYLVTSLAPDRADAAALLRLNRGHWGIENRSHWVRDETFGEDRSRVRTGTGPRAVAGVRNGVIATLRLHGHQAITATRQFLAGHPAQALALIGLSL